MGPSAGGPGHLPSHDGQSIWRLVMNGNSLRSRRILSARRIALLATTAAAIGTAAFLFAPNLTPRTDPFGIAAQAQNLTEKVQQLPQHPIGFADIVEKVKPAVISVRVKMER